jgi:L-amino acid N-acyltransferase YncA
MQRYSFTIRRATEADASAIASIIAGVAAERIYSAITVPWSVAEQQAYLSGLSQREAIHLAEASEGSVIGYQTLDLWAPTLDSMAHVGQVGTFLRPAVRGQGIGEALFRQTSAFAREHGYSKLVIQVRGSNLAAQKFYSRLGFQECGRLRRQVRVDGVEDDEVLMEMFL